jgi:hypothetical protein
MMSSPVRPRSAVILVLALAWLSAPAGGASRAFDDAAVRQALDAALTGIFAPSVHEGTRRLEGSSPGRSAWIEVATSYQVSSGFTYRITAEGGNESVRQRALVKVLEGEVKATRQPEGGRPTAADYRIGPPTATSEAWVVPLVPVRMSPSLVSGSLFLSSTGEPICIEGRMARSPSFWVKSVMARWNFASVGGGTLPVRVDAIADIRFVGQSRFSMTYVYRTVSGRAVPAASFQQVRMAGRLNDLLQPLRPR